VSAQDPADGVPHETLTVARNVSSRYLALLVESGVGLLMLPFNVSHLGLTAYGLWMLTASVTAYFSILDLGYAGSIVRFVAHYRERRDPQALNEILSTMFFTFLALGLLTYLAGAGLAFNLHRIFTLTLEQAALGRTILLVLSLTISLEFAFTIFGGVVNGFQRYDLNNLVGSASSVVTAIVNVVVLLAGYGLVQLVMATTAVRLLTFWIYRANAYRVFPQLRVSRALFRRARLRELTSFSVYFSISDWAAKLNYSVDALVVGAWMGPAAVAIWAVGQRVAEAVMRITNQLNEVLFPAIVGYAAASRNDRLTVVLLQATRLSLAAALAIGRSVAVMAEPLIRVWVGPAFHQSVVILQLLIATVIIRIGNGTAITVLKGAGHHRLVALANACTAVVNLGLSIALVRLIGFVGVAIGTIVPIALGGLLVIFPAACRRVGVPLRTAFARAVWPALWPGAVLMAVLLALRPFAGATLLGVAAIMGLGVLVYATVFFFLSIGVDDRRLYTSKLVQLTWHSRRVQPLSEGA
jgi:O-antigen/teichoic acid export membrane protein